MDKSKKEKSAPVTGKEETARRQLFCYFLARLGNPREAAIQAGYSPREAARKAAQLLENKELQEKILHSLRMEEQHRSWQQALNGLRRLAFGSANDAAALVMGEGGEDPPDVHDLDLYMVSEIKRPKGGGCEIKLYDRLAALEALLEHDGTRTTRGDGSLQQALEQSARALARGDDSAV